LAGGIGRVTAPRLFPLGQIGLDIGKQRLKFLI
jgi:hypothetical protein